MVCVLVVNPHRSKHTPGSSATGDGYQPCMLASSVSCVGIPSSWRLGLASWGGGGWNTHHHAGAGDKEGVEERGVSRVSCTLVCGALKTHIHTHRGHGHPISRSACSCVLCSRGARLVCSCVPGGTGPPSPGEANRRVCGCGCAVWVVMVVCVVPLSHVQQEAQCHFQGPPEGPTAGALCCASVCPTMPCCPNTPNPRVSLLSAVVKRVAGEWSTWCHVALLGVPTLVPWLACSCRPPEAVPAAATTCSAHARLHLAWSKSTRQTLHVLRPHGQTPLV